MYEPGEIIFTKSNKTKHFFEFEAIQQWHSVVVAEEPVKEQLASGYTDALTVLSVAEALAVITYSINKVSDLEKEQLNNNSNQNNKIYQN